MKKKGGKEAPRPGMMTQQVCTGAKLLTKHSWKVTERLDKPDSHNDFLSEPPNEQPNTGCRAMPSQLRTTKQVRTGANLLTNLSQKVTMPTDRRKDHNPPKSNKIHIS